MYLFRPERLCPDPRIHAIRGPRTARSSAAAFSGLAFRPSPAAAFRRYCFKFSGATTKRLALIAKSQWLADGWRPSADLWFIKDALINGVILGFQDSSLAQWFGFPAALLASMANSYVTPLWTLSIEFYGSILVLLLARSRSWTLLILAAIILSRTYLLCFLVGHVAARFDLGGKRLLVSWPLAAAAALVGLAVCLTEPFLEPGGVGEVLCGCRSRFFRRARWRRRSYLMRVYGATLFTRWSDAMRADPDLPGPRATARPRPIVVPDLPDPLAYHFRPWEFFTHNIDALDRIAAGTAPGVGHQYRCDYFGRHLL